MLVSSRKRGSSTTEQLSFPIEFTGLHRQALDRLQAWVRPIDPRQIDPPGLILHRFEFELAAFLAHDHLLAGFQPERLGQPQRDRIARFEHLGAIFLCHRFLRIYIMYIHSHPRSEEHTSELKSLMRISYADFCLQK